MGRKKPKGKGVAFTAFNVIQGRAGSRSTGHTA